MSIAKDVKNDIRAAKKMRLPWWAVLCLLVFGMPLPWLFEDFGRLNLMLPVWNAIAVFSFIFVLKWRLRQHAWFWITMGAIMALHIPLILFVPWGTRWIPALAIAAIDSVDFCLILWILSSVEKLAERQRGAER